MQEDTLEGVADMTCLVSRDCQEQDYGLHNLERRKEVEGVVEVVVVVAVVEVEVQGEACFVFLVCLFQIV